MKKILLLLFCLALLPAPAFAADANDFFALSAAAEQGDAAAQYNLGILYLNRQGDAQNGAQNGAKAAGWLEKAAEQGHLKAALALGDLRATGENDLQDYAAAAKWYRKAAELGSTEAQYKLGNLYANGQGVKQAYDEAYFWYLLASSADDEDAGKNRDQTAGMLSPQQIADEKARAKDWKPVAAPAAPAPKDQ